MTQKNKKLLLKDLSSRLPYGVKIHLDSPKYGELIGILYAVYPTEERIIVDELDKAIAPINVRCGGFKIEENKVKPYLRPMSSMTKAEAKEYNKTLLVVKGHGSFCTIDSFDYLISRGLDVHDLITKGLALEAPKDMYNIS